MAIASGGESYRQLLQALTSAFNPQELAQLCRIELGVSIDEVSEPGNLSQRAFTIIEWAIRHGRLAELKYGAFNQNSGNSLIWILIQDAQMWPECRTSWADTS